MDEGADGGSSSSSAVPPLDRPYHTKRPHKKSRAGCRNCKTRKVKCDEARPACRNCVLRRAVCTYPPTAPGAATSSQPGRPRSGSPAEHASTTADGSPARGSPVREIKAEDLDDGGVVSISNDDGSSSGSSSSSSIVVREPLFLPTPTVDTTDMKLLWFYTNFTYSSFSSEGSRGEVLDDILKIRIPQEAFGNPFLMDTLLALSALQMQALDQEIDPRRALDLRARSFEGYRRAVEAARPETHAALLANSLLLTALSSQMFRETDTKELYIIDWMVVWRGIGLIVDLADPAVLAASRMGGLFLRPTVDLEGSTSHIPNYLLFMVSSMGLDDPDRAHQAAYYEALKYLGSLYAELKNGINAILGLRIVVWFTFLPDEFVELARRRRPRALVIIAHYLGFNMFLQGLWWQQGIGRKSVRQIADYVGPDFADLLRVPLAAMALGDDMYIELAQLLLDDPTWMPMDYFRPIDANDIRPRPQKFIDIADNTVDLPGTIAETGSIWRMSPTPSWKIESPCPMLSVPDEDEDVPMGSPSGSISFV